MSRRILTAGLLAGLGCGSAPPPPPPPIEPGEVETDEVETTGQSANREEVYQRSKKAEALPEVPEFSFPRPEGVLSVADLFRRRDFFFERTVTIEGVVVFKRDCADRATGPGTSRSRAIRRIQAEPDSCQPSELVIGALKDVKDRSNAPQAVLMVAGTPPVFDAPVGSVIVVRGQFTDATDDVTKETGFLNFGSFVSSSR